MLRPDQMRTEIEQITHRCMGTQESLSLLDRFELPHPSLPDSGGLMGLRWTVVFMLWSTVNRIWY